LNKREAYELLSRIEIDSRVGPAVARQIGNGEWVVILKARTWHCFEPADYVKYLQLLEQKSEQKQQRKMLVAV
jgi:hypothetical protein